MKTKICSKCKIEKEISEFYKDKTQKDGLQSRCKMCNKKTSKQWVKLNHEYYKNHRLNNKEYYKEWRLENPGYHKQYNKQWRLENPEYASEYNKEYDTKIPASVYWIWEQHKDNSELIYIGESSKPNKRMGMHFSKRKNLEQAIGTSNVSYAISIGEIKRKDLYFNVFHYENDDDTRKQIEAEYITAFTPRYNKEHVYK